MSYPPPHHQQQQQVPPMRPPSFPPPPFRGGAAPAPPPAKKVNQGWTEHKGPNGRPYWYNVATKQSVWEKPAALKTSAEIRLSLCPWKEFTNAANGRKYYHNSVTKESAWIKPKELADIELSLGIGAPPPVSNGAVAETPPFSAAVSAPTNPVLGVPPQQHSQQPVLQQQQRQPPQKPPQQPPHLQQQQHQLQQQPPLQPQQPPQQQPPPQLLQQPPIHQQPPPLQQQQQQPLYQQQLQPPPQQQQQPPQQQQQQLLQPGQQLLQPQVVPIVAAAPTPVVVAPVAAVVVADPAPTIEEGLMYATKEEAREAFRNMLTDENVSADWSWDKVKRAVALKPKYNALKREGERKQAWKAWQPMRAKIEKEEKMKESRLKRTRLQDLVMLVDEIDTDTTYRQAAELLRTHYAFKNVKNDRERQEVFKDAIHVKIAAQKNEEKEKKRASLAAITSIIKNLEMPEITVDTAFEEAREAIRNCDEFKQTEGLAGCHDLVLLEGFQAHIEQLQREADDNIRDERVVKRNLVRHSRENFIILLDEMQQAEMLNAGTLWKEHAEFITADPRYVALMNVCEHKDDILPISLFKLRIETMKEALEDDRKLLRSIMKSVDYRCKPETTLEEFHESLCNDARYVSLSSTSLRLCHKLFVEDAIEDEIIRQEKLKVLMRSFSDMLQYGLKKIKKGDLWEDVGTIFQRHGSYRDLDDEPELRETLFNEFVASDPWSRESSRSDRRRSRSRSRSPRRRSRSRSPRRRSSRRSRSRSVSSDSEDDRKDKHRKKKHKKEKKDRKESKSKRSSKKKRKEDSSDDGDSDDSDKDDLERKRAKLLAELAN